MKPLILGLKGLLAGSVLSLGGWRTQLTGQLARLSLLLPGQPGCLVSSLLPMHCAVSHLGNLVPAVPSSETFFHFLFQVSAYLSFLRRALPDVHPRMVPFFYPAPPPPPCTVKLYILVCLFPRSGSVSFIAMSAGQCLAHRC